MKPKNQTVQIETTTPISVTQYNFSDSVSETLSIRNPIVMTEEFDAPVVVNRIQIPNNANIPPNTGFIQGLILPAHRPFINRNPALQFFEQGNFHEPIRHISISNSNLRSIDSHKHITIQRPPIFF